MATIGTLRVRELSCSRSLEYSQTLSVAALPLSFDHTVVEHSPTSDCGIVDCQSGLREPSHPWPTLRRGRELRGRLADSRDRKRVAACRHVSASDFSPSETRFGEWYGKSVMLLHLYSIDAQSFAGVTRTSPMNLLKALKVRTSRRKAGDSPSRRVSTSQDSGTKKPCSGLSNVMDLYRIVHLRS